MRLPKVKPEHAAYRLADGRIRIGGEIYGLAHEIEDPHGWVWAAVTAMDGTRTAPEIVELICARFPDLSPQTAAALVDQLIGSGHVEDAGATPPEEFSARERERYDRSHAFLRWIDLTPREHGWEAQIRLRRAKVLLVGLGSTGCAAAWALAASGVGTLHCVDFDTVELSNLNRQILFTERDIGRLKSEAAVERLRQVNSDIVITAANLRVTSQEEMLDLVAGFDLVVLCADEPRGPDGIRIWTDRACRKTGIPWVGGGYHGPLITVGTYVPGLGPCYECVQRTADLHRERPDAPIDLGGPGVMAASGGISGLLAAHAAIRVLTRVPELTSTIIHGLNLIAPDHHVYAEYDDAVGCVH